MGHSGKEAEELYKQAPSVRLEAETCQDTTNQLFGTIAYLTKEKELTNLIRGFVQTELNFYSDTSYKKVCRWWSEYLKPNILPVIHKRYEESAFDATLNWYQYHDGFVVTQAIYLLVNNDVPSQPKLIGDKEHYV